MDISFCTTDPKSLNIDNKHKVLFMPNPVDESFRSFKKL